MGWKKEIVDQPLHALWSGGSAVALSIGWQLGAPLWASVLLTVCGVLSLAAICFREWWQKHRKPGGILANWPWTDTIGYSAGLVAAALVLAFL